MRRGTIFVLLFIVVAAGVVGVSQFLRTQPPLTITVAVDSLAEDWISEAAERFNATEPLANGTQRINIEASVVSDMDVWQGQAGWTTDRHPDAWIPSSSVSVTYAQGANIPVQIVQPSTARTLLVWGGYASRVDVLTKNGTVPLDWDGIAEAANTDHGLWEALGGQSSWRFLKLAFALPDQTMNGLGVLFSSAGDFGNTTDLSGGATRSTEFYTWLQPIIESVPNFQTLGGDIASTVARGPSTVEIAILPESQWLLNLRATTSNEDIRLNYPVYQFVFDFPVTRWDSTTTSDTQRAAVKLFADWLMRPDEQTRVLDKGLRPANTEPTTQASLFAAAEPYGIVFNPTFQIVQAPSRTEAQGLVSWFATSQRR